jgi:hypothetical protein
MRPETERTVLTAIASGASPAELVDLATDRAFADTGHSLDFINKAFQCLDLIGWEHAAAVLPIVVGQMAVRGAEESTAWRAGRAVTRQRHSFARRCPLGDCCASRNALRVTHAVTCHAAQANGLAVASVSEPN